MFKHILITTMLVTLIAACGSSPKTKPKADEAPCDTSALKANSAMLGIYKSPLCDVNEEPECKSDSDCPGDEFCTDGTCALQEGICESDPECGTGKECQEGSCVDISKDTVKAECSSNSDCDSGSGEKCSNNACVKTTTTTDACYFDGDENVEFSISCDDIGTNGKIGTLRAHCTLGKTNVAWTIVKPTSIVNEKTTNSQNSIQTFTVGTMTFDECKAIAGNSKTITVTACDNTKSAVCTDIKKITLKAIIVDLKITTPLLLKGIINEQYTSPKLAATGGSGEYTWSIEDGSNLPDGLQLNGDIIKGTPTAIASSDVKITLTDNKTQQKITATFHIDISENFTISVFLMTPKLDYLGNIVDASNPTTWTKEEIASTLQDIQVPYRSYLMIETTGTDTDYKWTVSSSDNVNLGFYDPDSDVAGMAIDSEKFEDPLKKLTSVALGISYPESVKLFRGGEDFFVNNITVEVADSTGHIESKSISKITFLADAILPEWFKLHEITRSENDPYTWTLATSNSYELSPNSEKAVTTSVKVDVDECDNNNVGLERSITCNGTTCTIGKMDYNITTCKKDPSISFTIVDEVQITLAYQNKNTKETIDVIINVAMNTEVPGIGQEVVKDTTDVIARMWASFEWVDGDTDMVSYFSINGQLMESGRISLDGYPDDEDSYSTLFFNPPNIEKDYNVKDITQFSVKLYDDDSPDLEFDMDGLIVYTKYHYAFVGAKFQVEVNNTSRQLDYPLEWQTRCFPGNSDSQKLGCQ